MANARLIQEALINLLESKKANTTAQKGVSSQLKGGMVDQVDADIADARAADLARKRVEAQRVQGTDSLRNPAPEFEAGSGGAFPVKRTIPQDPSRLPDTEAERTLERDIRSMSLRGEDEASMLNRTDVEAERAANAPQHQFAPSGDNFERMVEEVMSGKLDIRDAPKQVAEEVIRRDMALGEL